jgi:hypothetical protein
MIPPVFAYPGGIDSGDPSRPTYTWLPNPYPDVAPYGTIRKPGDPDFEHGRYGFLHSASTPRYDHNITNTTLPEGDILKVLVNVATSSVVTYDPGYNTCWPTKTQHWAWCWNGAGWICESYCSSTARSKPRYDNTYNLYKYEYGQWIPRGSVVETTYGPETTYEYHWPCNYCNQEPWWWLVLLL